MTQPEAEFSRPVAVAKISARGRELKIAATTDELSALAKRYDIPEVKRLTARLHLSALDGGKAWRLDGTFDAEVVQQCVVTLKPLQTEVTEHFERIYAIMPDDETGAVDVIYDQDDPPDPVIDGFIDAGEAVAEELALALVPFPRAPETEFQSSPGDGDGAALGGPFAVLARLRENNR